MRAFCYELEQGSHHDQLPKYHQTIKAIANWLQVFLGGVSVHGQWDMMSPSSLRSHLTFCLQEKIEASPLC